MQQRNNVLRTVRTLAGLLMGILIALVLVGILIVLQGQRNEPRRVDAILVMPADPSANVPIGHMLNLYRRGYASRILFIGNDLASTQELLQEHRQPGANVFFIQSTGDSRLDLRNAAAYAVQQEIRSVLIVDEPVAMLRNLKMARDLGFVAYGSPLPDSAPHIETVLQASVQYWEYVLLYGNTPMLE
jgi:uncharacterized SAM-binding protein YcdF (DUF218 family)